MSALRIVIPYFRVTAVFLPFVSYVHVSSLVGVTGSCLRFQWFFSVAFASFPSLSRLPSLVVPHKIMKVVLVFVAVLSNHSSRKYCHGFARSCGINKQQFWNTTNYSKYAAKCRGNFCPAFCSTGIFSMCFHLPLCFILVSSHFSLYLVVLCLCLCLFFTAKELPHQWWQKGSPLSTFSDL